MSNLPPQLGFQAIPLRLDELFVTSLVSVPFVYVITVPDPPTIVAVPPDQLTDQRKLFVRVGKAVRLVPS